jgi:phage antirepressor YoqD-like protein
MTTELATLEQKETLTSLELLDQINVFRAEEKRTMMRHYDFAQIIRDELSVEIDKRKISFIYQKDQRNRDQLVYILSLGYARRLLLRESKEVRRRVTEYIETLEEQNKKLVEMVIQKQLNTAKTQLLEYEQREKEFTDTIEKQEKAIKKQEKTIKKQAKKLEEQQPKIDYLKQITEAKGVRLTMTIIASEYGWSAKKLNNLLCKHKFMRKTKSKRYVLYAKYNKMNKGNQLVKVTTRMSKGRPKYTYEYTEKARMVIHMFLMKEGLLDDYIREAEAEGLDPMDLSPISNFKPRMNKDN